MTHGRMSALVVHADRDNLRATVATLPVPEAGPGEVLVRVHQAALGFTDYLLTRGDYHHRPTPPFTLGGEAAGVVVGVGAEGDPSWLGRRVIVTPGVVPCGLAQGWVTVSPESLLPVPDGMSMPEAATLFIAYHTAHLGLFRRGGLRSGETLVVSGALGGVGSAVVQLGLAAGARVVAVASGPERTTRCVEELGAHLAVDRTAGPLRQSLERAVGKTRVDVAFDVVGGEFFDAVRHVMAPEGRIVVAGFASGTIPSFTVNHALLRNYSVVGFRTWPMRSDPQVRRAIHNELVALHASGQVRPLVREVALADALQELGRADDGSLTGRLSVNLLDAPA